MYLTRIDLNLRDRALWRLLSDTQAVHTSVIDLVDSSNLDFKSDRSKSQGQAPPIWRLDTDPGALRLWVLSSTEPNASASPLSATEVTTRRMDDAWNAIENGDEFGFRLAANTVRRKPTDIPRHERVNGKRVYGKLVSTEPLSWLRERQRDRGFQVLHLADHATETDVFFKEKRNCKVTLARTAFSGRLVVTDADALRNTLRYGMGRGKAHGCGLLTIAPVR